MYNKHRSPHRTTVTCALTITATGAIFLVLAGCGGGGSTTKTASKTAIKSHVITAARTTRNTLVVAGLVSTVSPLGQFSSRPQSFSSHVLRPHDITPGSDIRTGLYYVLTTNADGSGDYALFTDAAHLTPAGTITWPAPQYAGGVAGTYPAVYHVTYNITAGSYQGNRGTADVTVKDASGTKELIHEVGNDQQGDAMVADLNIDNGQISGTEHDTLSDGSTQDGQLGESANGDVQDMVSFGDGDHASVTEHTDGSQNEILTGPDGEQGATENVGSDGQGNVNYQDGTSDPSENVNNQGS